jgi:hypothetical protein
MAGDQPSGFNEGSTIHPHTGQRPPTSSPRPTGGLRAWAAIALAAIAAVVAVAALIVALTRPSSSAGSATTKAPTYSATDIAAAQQQLCDTYKLVAKAVQVDTAGTDKALARIADTNGAVMLDLAAANVALDAAHRDAARALAAAYGTVTAMGNSVVASDADYRAAIDDVVAKDAVMKKVCGGG